MLTDKVITQAKPKEKLYRLSDNIGNGLSLEVSPEGGKRWRFRYRFNGKAKMITCRQRPSRSALRTSAPTGPQSYGLNDYTWPDTLI